MNQIEIKIQLPQLWAGEFNKEMWGDINTFVGANGTGKSLFVEQLKNQLNQKGYKTRLLNAERLSGFEKTDYHYFSSGQLTQGLNISNFSTYKSQGESFGLSSSAFVVLKERLDIRIQIEAFLSDMFKKTIRLVEEGGFLKPKIQNIQGGSEYGLKEQECHGLKELITLLTYLYDQEKECLILDEPELHLHPQFQSFFLSEIKRIAGNPKTNQGKKIFFLVTHSPYFLELTNIDELRSVIVFQTNKIPLSITDLDGQDEYILKKFLPRFNTHHKQFFFSSNPVFVEGYTDQQLITLLYNRLGINIGASGSCVIDVGGKDELGYFYKLCEKLQIASIIIADLDALFKGKLREVICENTIINEYIQKNGIGESISSEIGDLEVKIKDIGIDIKSKTSSDVDMSKLISHLNTYTDLSEQVSSFRMSALLGIIRFKEKIESLVSPKFKSTISLIFGRLNKLIEACRLARIHILDKGELEHYYKNTSIDYLNITNKDVIFHSERDFILNESLDRLKSDYNDLIDFLSKVIPVVSVDIMSHYKYEIIEWMQKLQSSIVRGEIKNIDDLKSNGRINYLLYSQIFTITEFQFNEATKKFLCIGKMSKFNSDNEMEFHIDESTTAHNLVITKST